MGLTDWFRDSAEDARLRLSIARWRFSRLARDSYRRGHVRGYSAGHRDGSQGVVSRHHRPFPAPHEQSEVFGIEVDSGLKDLLVALWQLGLDTQYSCEGHSEHYVPGLTGSWEESAQIFFTDADGALKFVKKSMELLGDDGYHEGGYRMHVCNGIDSPIVRAEVRFSPALIHRLTDAWTAFEREISTRENKTGTTAEPAAAQ